MTSDKWVVIIFRTVASLRGMQTCPGQPLCSISSHIIKYFTICFCDLEFVAVDIEFETITFRNKLGRWASVV